MERTKRVQIWVGGSDTPFTFDATDMEFACAIKSLESGKNFYMDTRGSANPTIFFFNASRVDAIQLVED